MKNVLIFPPDPIRAALTHPEWMEKQSQRVTTLAQQAGLYGVEDIILAKNPTSKEEALKAAQAYVTAVQYGKDERRAKPVGLLLLEAEPLFQNLLAWFRWDSHHKAPWNSLFERPAGMTLQALKNYANEGLILCSRFGTPEQVRPHKKALETVNLLEHSPIDPDDQPKRIKNAARASTALLQRLVKRREQREVMLWGNNPSEEFLWCVALGAYTQRVEITSHLGTSI